MISFKKATLQDISEIERLANIIWPVCYKEMISAEQLTYMLQLIYSPAALSRQIEKDLHQFILVTDAEVNIGFISYTTLPDNSGTHHLNKIYLLPPRQGEGLGKQMLQYAEKAVQELGAAGLALNVNKYNPALEFYKHNGYTLKEEAVIDIGNGFVMDDFILIKNL